MPARSRQDGENIRVLTEVDAAQAWRFKIAVPADAGHATEISVVLSWVDYEYWSHGQASPSRVAEVVVRALLDAQPDRPLPTSFDASTARRWVRDLDERVRELL